MMMEEINGFSNEDNSAVVESHKKQQIVTSATQVEQIANFLLECPEAAQNVHNYLQKKYANQHQQQHIHPANSTPKRGHPLDESGESINNGNGRRKYPRRGLPEVQQQVLAHDGIHRKRLSFDQLKHAVSSNLPCFHIDFMSSADRKKVPSALNASDLIFKELQANGVTINRFTLVGWAGKRLKLGVNNKEDYATLVATDKWPAKINGIDVVVLKPKFIPDSFALVVRYVPQEYEVEFVATEIQRTIESADRIKRIHYAYQRKTSDFRFDVKDYQEYNVVLQLGRIAIGHSWLSITPFFSGNRLTYCTRCWCIGHLRNKCNAANKCRVCLEIISDDVSHVCRKEPKCAQCDGKHHSLDNQCHIIRDYKLRLKEDVEDAIKKGQLHRFAPKEQALPTELLDQDFPTIKVGDNQPRKMWNTAQSITTCQSNTTNVREAEKLFEEINNKLSKLVDSNIRMENKVDRLAADLKVVNLDTQLHQAVLEDVINTMKEFTQKFIPALLNASKLERYSLLPVAQQYFGLFQSASTRLSNGFRLNREVSLIPLATAQPTSIMETTTNMRNGPIQIYK